MPEEFANIPFNPVTDNCAPDFLTGCDAQPRRLEVILTPHNKKTANSRFMLCGRKLKKFSSLPQTCRFWKCCRSVDNHARIWIILLQFLRTGFYVPLLFCAWSPDDRSLWPSLPENRGYACVRCCLADRFFSSWFTSTKLFFRKWVIKHTSPAMSSYILYPHMILCPLICLEKEGRLCYCPSPSIGLNLSEIYFNISFLFI